MEGRQPWHWLEDSNALSRRPNVNGRCRLHERRNAAIAFASAQEEAAAAFTQMRNEGRRGKRREDLLKNKALTYAELPTTASSLRHSQTLGSVTALAAATVALVIWTGAASQKNDGCPRVDKGSTSRPASLLITNGSL